MHLQFILKLIVHNRTLSLRNVQNYRNRRFLSHYNKNLLRKIVFYNFYLYKGTTRWNNIKSRLYDHMGAKWIYVRNIRGLLFKFVVHIDNFLEDIVACRRNLNDIKSMWGEIVMIISRSIHYVRSIFIHVLINMHILL